MAKVRKSPARPGETSQIGYLAALLMPALRIDQESFRNTVEGQIKPLLIRYIEKGLGRKITTQDAYTLHNGTDPDHTPQTYTYARLLRYCLDCSDHDYNEGTCQQLMLYMLAAAPGDLIRVEQAERRIDQYEWGVKSGERRGDLKKLVLDLARSYQRDGDPQNTCVDKILDYIGKQYPDKTVTRRRVNQILQKQKEIK